MKDVVEIRIHGRGGQGAKTAAQFIAEAALDKGKQIQSFPEFGPERSGAPMKAYARVSDKKIKTFAPVVNPDIVIVIDPTLVNESVAEGLNKKGILLVNSSEESKAIRKKTKFLGRIYVLDATKISLDAVGKNLPNTPMLGALAKISDVIDLSSLNKKVNEKFLEKIGKEKTEATISAIKKAYEAL